MLDWTDQNCGLILTRSSIIEELALQRCCGQVSGTDLLQGDQDSVRVKALLRFGGFFSFSFTCPSVRVPQPLADGLLDFTRSFYFVFHTIPAPCRNSEEGGTECVT